MDQIRKDTFFDCSCAVDDLDAARKAALRDYDIRINKLKKFMQEIKNGGASDGELMPTPFSVSPEVQGLIDDPLKGL